MSCRCVGSASREVPGGVKRVEANEGRQTTCVLAMRVVRARHNKRLTVSIPLPAGPGGYTRAPGSARPQLRPIPDGCRGRGRREEEKGRGGRKKKRRGTERKVEGKIRTLPPSPPDYCAPLQRSLTNAVLGISPNGNNGAFSRAACEINST